MKKLIHWLPRALTIIIIALFFLLSFGVFAEDWTGGEKAVGFLMQNVPTSILLAVLLIAWKKPKIGGYIFLAISVVMVFFFHLYDDLLTILTIALPMLLISGFFLYQGYQPDKKKGKLTLTIIFSVLGLLMIFLFLMFYLVGDIPNIEINEADQTCNTDNDCVMVNYQCSCDCGRPVNKQYREKYEQEFEEICSDYNGLRCSMQCNFVLKCKDGMCTAVTD